ncbi:hypothetical protein EON66_10475, partial [archaeon]
MVCNFTKPTASTPSLLRHEEVVTLCTYRTRMRATVHAAHRLRVLRAARPRCPPCLCDSHSLAVHEFGHVTHHLLSNTRLHRFSSFRCEMDFVEAPSQMLEVRRARRCTSLTPSALSCAHCARIRTHVSPRCTSRVH